MEVVTPKLTVALILGSIASYFSEIGIFIIFVVLAIMIDYISGLIAGSANEGLSSKKATKGLKKKMGIFFLLVLGLFLDGCVNHLLTENFEFFELPFNTPIAHIVTVWIVITEAISVCENLGRAGVPIPAFLLKILRKAENKLNSKENKEDNDNDRKENNQ